jgi:hypothetical protein
MSDDQVTVLPDGSAFMIGSFPLPKDHWIYEENGDPPMSLGQVHGEERQELAEKIRAAAKYAIRGATWSGKDMDFDPDALMQNLIIGLIGYGGGPPLERSGQ